MAHEIVLLSFVFVLFSQTNAYKILIFSPAISHSHSNFMGKIADSLLDAGHEVLTYVPVYDPEVLTNGTKRAPVLRVDVIDDPTFFQKHPMKSDPFNENLDMMDDDSLGLFIKMLTKGCEGQVSNKELLQTLSDYNFDIAISEFFDYCPFGIFKLLNIRSNIVASAMPLTQTISDLFGVPQPLSYVSNIFGPSTDEMSYKERVMNMLMFIIWENMLQKTLRQETEIIQRYHSSDFPLLEDLAKKTALAFVNADEFFEVPRPISHRIIYVGGIGIPEVKNLTKEVASIVETCDKGVILLSFGSIAKSILLPMEKKWAILRTAANFPEYKFIWKYEQPEEDWELFSNSANVYPIKWVPQVDLLNHPNVKVFITHGGLNSMMEAITSGTPTVAVPLFGDQEHNVAVAAKRGVSVIVSKLNFNTETLTTALQDILGNEKYAANAKRLANMIAKKPLKPKDLIVKWTEFVAEFQDLSSLDIAGRDMSFTKYFLIDIFAPMILLVIVALLATIKIGLYVIRKISRLIFIKEKQL